MLRVKCNRINLSIIKSFIIMSILFIEQGKKTNYELVNSHFTPVCESRLAVSDTEEVGDRDEIRRERHKDRQRERNIARAAPDKR